MEDKQNWLLRVNFAPNSDWPQKMYVNHAEAVGEKFANRENAGRDPVV